MTNIVSFAQDNFKSDYAKLLAEVRSGSQAYTNLKDATERIGHRLTGSVNGQKAEQLVFDILTSYGYHVRFQPFEMVSWERKTLRMQVDGQELKAVSLAHSPQQAAIEAPLVDVGNGLEADYQNKEVEGKVVMAYLQLLPGTAKGTQNLHRSEKTALAARFGAKGIIFINAVQGGVLLTGTASITGKLIDIPAVCIGYEDGMALKQGLAKSAMSASIVMENKARQVNARNVIATLPGKTKEKIVVGGHLDSWDLATGAIDNGIGAFAVVDMARALKACGIKLKRTIEFVLFMGEEQGLLGSKAYVEETERTDGLTATRFMLNFDMTNAPTGFYSSREEMQNLYRNWLEQLQAVDSVYHGRIEIGAGLHSDHQPFMLKGIPYGGGSGGTLPNNAGAYYHSDRDIFELVDKQGMEQTVKLGAVLAYSLAQTATLPVARLNDEETRTYLERYGLKIPLQVSGDWKW